MSSVIIFVISLCLVLQIYKDVFSKILQAATKHDLCGKKNEVYTICQVSGPVDLTQTFGMYKSTQEKKSSKLSQPTGFFIGSRDPDPSRQLRPCLLTFLCACASHAVLDPREHNSNKTSRQQSAIFELRSGKTGSATIFEFYGMHKKFERLQMISVRKRIMVINHISLYLKCYQDFNLGGLESFTYITTHGDIMVNRQTTESCTYKATTTHRHKKRKEVRK